MKIEYWKSKTNRQWYSRIIGANGETMYSSEGYKRKKDCLSTIALVNVGGWEVVEVEG